jgi:uncharacterized OB-fold protein
MTATTRSAEDGTPEPGNETSQSHAPETDAADGLLVGMASPDRCTECGAEMAVDQRYCVECGNRRGPARFALARTTTVKSTAVVTTGQSSSRPSAFVLAATGIVIALLGLGVGVLIESKKVNVTVKGAAAAATTSGTSKGGTSSTSSSGGTSTGSSKTNFFGS